MGTSPSYRVNDLAGGLIKDPMVKRLQSDSDYLSGRHAGTLR